MPPLCRTSLVTALLLACAPGLASCCFFPAANTCGIARHDAKLAWAAYELDLQQRASIVATQLQIAEGALAEVTRLDARYAGLDPSRPFTFFGCPSQTGQPTPPPSPAVMAVIDAMQRERQRACSAFDFIAKTAATTTNPSQGFNLDLQLGPGFMQCPEDHRGMTAACVRESQRISSEFAPLLRSARELRVNVDSGTAPETLLQMSRASRVERTANPLRTAADGSLEIMRDRCD